MQLRSALQYLSYPANGASLILIAITSILVSIGWSTPAFGYPLLVIMLTWFLKFGLVIVEHIAWQVEGKPVLAVEMLNPVEQKKSLVLLILVCVIVFGIFAARRVLGNTGGALVALVAVTLLPAAVAVQTVRDSARTGFDIREWFAVIRWLNFDYLSVVLCIALVWVLAVILLLGPPKEVLPLFVRIALIMFGWLSVLAFLGGAILERRLAIQTIRRSREWSGKYRPKKSSADANSSSIAFTVNGVAGRGKMPGRPWNARSQKLKTRLAS